MWGVQQKTEGGIMPQIDDEDYYGTLIRSHLDDWANDTFSGLRKIVEQNLDPRITAAFSNACKSIENIKFGHTGESAFRIEGGTMYLRARFRS